MNKEHTKKCSDASMKAMERQRKQKSNEEGVLYAHHLSPRGYRFLVQRPDDCTMAEAVEWAKRVFGKTDVVAMKGHIIVGEGRNRYASEWKNTGWNLHCKKEGA